jgi:hypothetical protein
MAALPLPQMAPGRLLNGEAVRESAGTRSWEQAERNARKKEAEADPTRVEQAQPRRATIKDAIRMFLEDEEARGLEHSSRKKSRTLFERQFLPFCDPLVILQALNRRLLGRKSAQATAVTLRIAPDGHATLANAGHIPPYLNGIPLDMEGSLPLGMIEEADFSVMHFQIHPTTSSSSSPTASSKSPTPPASSSASTASSNSSATTSPPPPSPTPPSFRPGRRHQPSLPHPHRITAGVQTPPSSMKIESLSIGIS